ncbi:MAG: hypothetical protein KIS90_16585, partial [Phenylobacterium sp.]|nr:hypothetical protein [Phenylobacterium sp.]
MARSHTLACRSSEKGSWNGQDVPDVVNGPDEAFDVIYSGAPSYPAPSHQAGKAYGMVGKTTTSTNASQAASGSEPRLAGNINLGSGGDRLVRDLDPGDYLLQAAAGNAVGTGARTAFAVFEGTPALFASGVADRSLPIDSLLAWSSGLPVKVDDCAIVGGHVWKATQAGTTGGTAPGAGVYGDTFADGGVIWTHTGRVALLHVDRPNGNSLTSTVVDQNGDDIAASAWLASTPVAVTISGEFGYAAFVARAGVSCRFRCVRFTEVDTPL